MPVVAVGGTITIPAYFRNSLGEPVDVTDPEFTLTDILSVIVLHKVPPDVINPELGTFSYEWTVPGVQATGDYTIKWEGDFAGEHLTGFDQLIVVPPGYVSTGPLTFLIKPDDYEAVRGLLGVTTLDVEDTDIEVSVFGPQAESLIKRRVSNWATQIHSADTLFPLRMAGVYKTASLMAESWVRGGTIGYVRPLSSGEGRDWHAAAIQFEEGYEYWIAIADASDADGENSSDFMVDPIKIGGPTSQRIARRHSREATSDPYAAEYWTYPPVWRRR